MIEQEYSKKIKKFMSSSKKGLDLTKNLLCSIALGEQIPVASYSDRQITQAFTGLRRYKFIRRVHKDKQENLYLLTPKGESKLRTIVIDDVELKECKKWDEKWRLVMYDFPIRFKKARNSFRWKLKDLGFFQFQKSAWIYPYPCEDEVLFVADFYGVRKYLEILEVDKVLNEKKLKAHFGL